MSNWPRANALVFWNLAMAVIRDDDGGGPLAFSEQLAAARQRWVLTIER